MTRALLTLALVGCGPGYVAGRDYSATSRSTATVPCGVNVLGEALHCYEGDTCRSEDPAICRAAEPCDDPAVGEPYAMPPGLSWVPCVELRGCHLGDVCHTEAPYCVVSLSACPDRIEPEPEPPTYSEP